VVGGVSSFPFLTFGRWAALGVRLLLVTYFAFTRWLFSGMPSCTLRLPGASGRARSRCCRVFALPHIPRRCFLSVDYGGSRYPGRVSLWLLATGMLGYSPSAPPGFSGNMVSIAVVPVP